MDIETHDMTLEERAYREDMMQELENARAERAYLVALEFAQTHGGLAGYDPYAGMEDY